MNHRDLASWLPQKLNRTTELNCLTGDSIQVQKTCPRVVLHRPTQIKNGSSSGLRLWREPGISIPLPNQPTNDDVWHSWPNLTYVQSTMSVQPFARDFRTCKKAILTASLFPRPGPSLSRCKITNLDKNKHIWIILMLIHTNWISFSHKDNPRLSLSLSYAGRRFE